MTTIIMNHTISGSNKLLAASTLGKSSNSIINQSCVNELINLFVNSYQEIKKYVIPPSMH